MPVNLDRNFLLYDGDCPVCSRLVVWSRMKAARHDMQLLDARHQPELVAHFRARGMEINDGIVLQIDGAVFYGTEAITLIARLAEPDSRIVTLALSPLKSNGIAGLLYPLLVRLRKLLLVMIGRGVI